MMNLKQLMFLMLVPLLVISTAHAETAPPVKKTKPVFYGANGRRDEIRAAVGKREEVEKRKKEAARKPRMPVVLTEEQKSCFEDNGAKIPNKTSEKKKMDPVLKKKISDCLKRNGFKKPE